MKGPAQRHAARREAVGDAAFTDRNFLKGEVVHVVLFRFRAEVTESQRDNVKATFLDLQNKCLRAEKPYIREIVGGEPNGGEGAERGFEQGYVLRFASEGDRNYYVGTPTLSDPAHDAFKAFVGPLLEPGPGGVLVFDFDAGHA